MIGRQGQLVLLDRRQDVLHGVRKGDRCGQADDPCGPFDGMGCPHEGFDFLCGLFALDADESVFQHPGIIFQLHAEQVEKHGIKIGALG